MPIGVVCCAAVEDQTAWTIRVQRPFHHEAPVPSINLSSSAQSNPPHPGSSQWKRIEKMHLSLPHLGLALVPITFVHILLVHTCHLTASNCKNDGEIQSYSYAAIFSGTKRKEENGFCW